MSKYNGISSKNHPDHSIYYLWASIKNRCYNKRSQDYPLYGKRGITMCDEWFFDFNKFYTWAKSHGYQQGLQIDRIDNEGHYHPNNCQFVTNAVNSGIGKRRKFNTNSSGYVGVSYSKDRGKYISYIVIDYKSKYLGYYSTPEQAARARVNAEIELFGQQRTNFHLGAK